MSISPSLFYFCSRLRLWRVYLHVCRFLVEGLHSFVLTGPRQSVSGSNLSLHHERESYPVKFFVS
jgi:hypothetical protein